MQYTIKNATLKRELFDQPLLDTTDPTIAVFEWVYLYDWAMGILYLLFQPIPHQQLFHRYNGRPHNLSAYCRTLCQYKSFVLALIAVAA
ncbi:hypothetical protein THRCLA_21447 [Thraustotheca clavata]|uniref:Uncharacterized protein n=1 Tax=Thraustotheca clavata TaxID=74557 RepID=A0A1V9ZWC7_9STRA|nr:hypothetical protein THRCLA_21447 [Thraustotheca clavata]